MKTLTLSEPLGKLWDCDFRFCQSTMERDRAIVAKRFLTCLATSLGLSAPASARRRAPAAGA